MGYGGLIQSYSEARKWYQPAANQGHEKATMALDRIRYK